MICQFCLLLLKCTGLRVKIRIWNKHETNSQFSNCFCGVLEERKIKERLSGCIGESGVKAEYGRGEEERRKHLQTNPLILKTLLGSEHGLWLAEFESDIIDMRSHWVLRYSADWVPEILKFSIYANQQCHDVITWPSFVVKYK